MLKVHAESSYRISTLKANAAFLTVSTSTLPISQLPFLSSSIPHTFPLLLQTLLLMNSLLAAHNPVSLAETTWSGKRSENEHVAFGILTVSILWTSRSRRQVRDRIQLLDTVSPAGSLMKMRYDQGRENQATKQKC
jgi:hypothetical protein